jgi:hypothetical protein
MVSATHIEWIKIDMMNAAMNMATMTGIFQRSSLARWWPQA